MLRRSQTSPPTKRGKFDDRFSTDGAYVITALKHGQSVIITKLQKNSSQSIDTKFAIHRWALAGNILLMGGDCKLFAWWFTEECVVGKALNSRRRNCNRILWTKPISSYGVELLAEHHIGIIVTANSHVCCDTRAGEELESVPLGVPSCSSCSWKDAYTKCWSFESQYPSIVMASSSTVILLRVVHHFLYHGVRRGGSNILKESANTSFSCLLTGGVPGMMHIGLTRLQPFGYIRRSLVWLLSSFS